MKKCPTCKHTIDPLNQRHWLPFCSERCRLIDLGAWLNEDHRIPADNAETPADINPKYSTTH